MRILGTPHLAFAAGLSLLAAGCTGTNTAPVTAAQAGRVVAAGQLFCAKATAFGPLVVTVATAAGGPVSVIGQARETVDATCGAIGGVAVSPPADPAGAPTITIPAITVPLRR